MSTAGPGLERRFFLLALALEAFFTLWLILGLRIPGGHDGFQYCIMQYVMLNDVAVSGEMPQWLPFFMHGNIATFCYVIVAGPAFQFLALLGRGLAQLPFLPLFHLGMMLDAVILLGGTWLLAKRFYDHPATIFFVSLAVAASSLWALQPWFNFKFFVALPLTLHFLHRFLETGRWRHFFLSGNLVAWQATNNLQYFLPAYGAVIFIYFVCFAVFQPRDVWRQVRGLKWSWPAAGALIGITLGLGAAYLLMQSGTESVVSYSLGRGTDNRIDLGEFLHGVGRLPAGETLELALALPLREDYTFYAGILTLLLLPLGIFSPRFRRTAHLPLVMIVLFLIATGTFLARIMYYGWPMFSWFRPLYGLLPVTRFFFCLAAGAGLESLLSGEARVRRGAGWLGCCALGAGAVFMLIARNPSGPAHLLAFMLRLPADAVCFLAPVYYSKFPEICRPLVASSAWMMSAAGGLLLAFTLARGAAARRLILLLLLLHAFDLYHYRFSIFALETVPLPPQDHAVFDWHRYDFPMKRLVTDPDPRGRERIIRHLLPGEIAHLYGITYSFFQLDERDCYFRTDYWLKPFDCLYHAAWGTEPPWVTGVESDSSPLYTPATAFPEELRAPGLPMRLRQAGVVFPDSPLWNRLTGVVGKIRLYGGAHEGYDDHTLSARLQRVPPVTDVLSLTASPTSPSGDSERWTGCHGASISGPLPMTCTPIFFSANRLTLDLDIPESDSIFHRFWLVYDDVWHPGWRATVNGAAMPVERADLAYKAVRVPYGRSRVEFTFSLPFMTVLQRFFQANNLFWLMMITRLVWREIIGGRR